MVEQLKTQEAAEAPYELLQAEREEFSDIANDLIVEKNPERRLKRASRLAMTLLASVVAFHTVSKPEEAAAQEPVRTVAALEARRTFESEKLTETFRNFVKANELEHRVQDAGQMLAELQEFFWDDVGFSDWMEYYEISTRLGALYYSVSNTFIFDEFDLNNAMSAADSWRKVQPLNIHGISAGPAVKGFEHLQETAGLHLPDSASKKRIPFSNEQMKKIMEQRYGKAALAPVEVVIYVPKESEVQQGSRVISVLGTAISISFSKWLGREDPRDSVTVFLHDRDSSADILASLLSTLDHEIVGHSNDWEAPVIFSREHRVRFLYEVVKRYRASHRFTDPRLIKVEQEGFSLYYRVLEYWAFLAGEYLQNPDRLEKNYPNDYWLARKWIGYIKSLRIGELGAVER